jgi:hypothetical protein
MATVHTDAQETLLELAKAQNNGEILSMAMVLARVNKMLEDYTMMEANNPNFHKSYISKVLPSGTLRIVNRGVTKEFAAGAAQVDNVVVIESRNELDELQVNLAGKNGAKYRAQKDQMFIEGLGQTIAHQLVYGTTLITGETTMAVDEIQGLSSRVILKTASNAVDAGGSGGDTSSVWVIEPGVGKTYLVYPNGYQIGISKEDLGRLTVFDGSSRAYMAWVSLFKGAVGLVVEDPRAIQRICNIETAGSSNIITAEMIIDAVNRLPNRGEGAYIYCNRTIAGYIEKAGLGTTAHPVVRSGEGNPWGSGRVNSFQGIPIRMMESLCNTEVVLS